MGAYLLSLVESFAVTVGQVHGPGHHAWAGFELLQGRLHVSAAGALCEDGGIGGMRGVKFVMKMKNPEKEKNLKSVLLKSNWKERWKIRNKRKVRRGKKKVWSSL